MTDPSERILLGTRKGLLILEKRRSAWNTAHNAFLGSPVSYATFDPRSGMLWAALDHGHWGPKLHRSTDQGLTWEEVEVPKYPSEAELKDGIPATLSYIWVIQPGGESQPNRLYLGTEPGGLFYSDDGGEHFELMQGLWDHPSRKTQWFGGGRDHPGVHSIFVDPRDNNRLIVGISVAGVFESTDGGANWEARNRGLYADYLPDPHAEIGQDPHLIVSCPTNPDILMQQNHCGIFRSQDGGHTWQDVSEADGPAKFGFAIAMHPRDPDTAWVVPAISDEQRMAVDGALCVCRTDDGGATWVAFRQGLPQADCFDFAYRHALDIAGENLAFGTTSGNLFFSQDLGESWETLGHYYPLIYSVRFLSLKR